jgi:hypothetical protein
VSQLLQEYDVSLTKLLADVTSFVSALEAHGLVVRVPAAG